MRKVLWIVLAVSLIVNLVFSALLLDAGIMLDNARSQVDLLWERREQALEIMRRDWLGRSADEVDSLARDLEAQGIPIGTEGDTREIGDFLFEIKDGLVTHIRDLDSGRAE